MIDSTAGTPRILMSAEAFFEEIRTPLRGLQLIVATLLVALAVYSGVVLVSVGIHPLDLAITTVAGTGLIVLLVVPLLAARAVLPSQITKLGLREIAAGKWSGDLQQGTAVKRLVARTGDVGRLWQLFSTQSLAACFLIAAAAFVSLTAYIFAPSAPPLALGTLLVVAISSHFPTRSVVALWMAVHLNAMDELRKHPIR